MKIFVVIPAYNEHSTIEEVVGNVKKFSKNIVVVDDGSQDETVKKAKQAGIPVLHHMVNLGKGAALKTGCDYAIREGADVLVVMDADMQHDPKDIPRLLEAIKDKDMVFTYRQKSKSMPFVLRFGNVFIQLLTEVLFGVRVKDTQCGFRAFTKEAYEKIRWISNDYSVESEMIARVGKKKLRFTQIPIETVYVDKYKGTTPIDGVKIVLSMLWWRVQGR